VYDQPLPGVRVVVKQVSPVLPGNYSDSSMPAGAFVVEVESTAAGGGDIEVSVMFSFENGYDDANALAGDRDSHVPFEFTAAAAGSEGEQAPVKLVQGVRMDNVRVCVTPSQETSSAAYQTSENQLRGAGTQVRESAHSASADVTHSDRGCFAIATSNVLSGLETHADAGGKAGSWCQHFLIFSPFLFLAFFSYSLLFSSLSYHIFITNF
jgi:hypothetical protein